MLERVGHLLVATDAKALVSVGTQRLQYEFCLIWFGPDGSIYIEPRLDAIPGILSVAGYLPDGDRLINLKAQGKAASRTAKLSHHPDGRVHFSQHGHVPANVGRMSFPLSTGSGKVFDLKVFNPTKLRPLTKEKRDRGHIRMQWSAEVPAAAVLSGHWITIDEILDRVPRTPTPTGPLVDILIDDKGNTVQRFLLRQPYKSPFRDHVLVLGLMKGTPGATDDVSAIFVGGMDAEQVGGPEVGLIAGLYPFDSGREQ